MSNYLDGILSGQSGYSKTTAAFTQPAVGSNVTVFVGNAGWAIAGVAVNIATGGAYQVVSVPSLTQLTLKNLGGSTNAAPASTVPTAQVIAPGGTPGQAGTPGAPIPIASVINSVVASLSAAPVSNDGYAFQIGDQVGLADPSQVGIYTYSSAATLTKNVTQPPAETQLRSTQGVNYKNVLYTFSPSALAPLNSIAGVAVGPNGTINTFAPDPAGGANKTVGNEPIDVTTLVAATPIVLWQYDFASRNFPTGVIFIEALFVQKTDSGKAVASRIDTVLLAGSPPAFHNDSIQYDIDDALGAGGYGPLAWSIVGNVLKLTCTPSLAGKGFGLVSFLQGNI